jgi:hypothetical protein
LVRLVARPQPLAPLVDLGRTPFTYGVACHRPEGSPFDSFTKAGGGIAIAGNLRSVRQGPPGFPCVVVTARFVGETPPAKGGLSCQQPALCAMARSRRLPLPADRGDGAAAHAAVSRTGARPTWCAVSRRRSARNSTY